MSVISISIFDMTELYSILLNHGSIKIPSLIVIDKMTNEFEGHPFYFGVPDVGSKETILVLEKNNLEIMKEKLLHCIRLYDNGANSSDMIISGYPFSSLSNPRKIYQNALDISQNLHIQCPQIMQGSDNYLKPYEAARRVTAIDDNDKGVGDCIFIKRRGLNYQLHSLAHELRHCWQEYNGNNFYKNYKELEHHNSIEFNMQPEEIDAEAYASLYMEKNLGFVDGTAFMYPSDENASDWSFYTEVIKKYMKDKIASAFSVPTSKLLKE